MAGKVRINRARWGRIVDKTSEEAADRAADRLIERLGYEVRASGRVQTGRLADEWFKREVAARTAHGSRIQVYSVVPYLRYQNDGTRGSQVIPPKKALRFTAGGQILFRKRTGPIPAARFMERARDSMRIGDWLP